MVLGALAAISLQLGLAILGWGGFAAFFAHPPFVAAAIAAVVLTVLSLFSGGNISPGEKEDRDNRWVLGAFSLLGLLLAYLPAYTDRHGVWTIDGEATRWSGFAILIAGSVVRLWPVFVLGRRFSGLVAIQKGHTLVTTGIYRYIRNPSYLGLVIGSFGWALLFRAGLGLCLSLLMFIPLIARIRAEERLLADHFGAEYERYRSRTWRLLPGVY
jgi:protein-S-isoprenylcysteine O-methyltransferase Ste14